MGIAGAAGLGINGAGTGPVTGDGIGGFGVGKEGLTGCGADPPVGGGVTGLVELLLNSLTKSFVSIVLGF